MTKGQTVKEQLERAINGNGTVLRVVTPLMTVIISVLVTIMLFIMTGMNNRVEKMDLHFTNHLMHHQDLEIGYERRITFIESNRFTDKDGKELEEKISSRVPPIWVKNKLYDLERGQIALEERVEDIKKVVRDLELKRK